MHLSLLLYQCVTQQKITKMNSLFSSSNPSGQRNQDLGSVNIRTLSLNFNKRDNCKQFHVKTESKQIRVHSIPKRVNRTYTETFQIEKPKLSRAFARVKTDVTSITWKLEKPLIAQIRGIGDFTKQQKLRLLNKRSNYRDFSALLLLKKKQKPKERLLFNPKSQILRRQGNERDNQVCEINKEMDSFRKSKHYKLLNMIGNKVPLYRIDGSLSLNKSPMFIHTIDQK